MKVFINNLASTCGITRQIGFKSSNTAPLLVDRFLTDRSLLSAVDVAKARFFMGDLNIGSRSLSRFWSQRLKITNSLMSPPSSTISGSEGISHLAELSFVGNAQESSGNRPFKYITSDQHVGADPNLGESPLESLIGWWASRDHVSLMIDTPPRMGREEIAGLLSYAVDQERRGNGNVAAEIYGTLSVAMAKGGKRDLASELLLMLGTVLRDMGDFDAVQKVVNLGRSIAPVNKDSVIEGKRCSLLADTFFRKGELENAILHYKQVAEICKNLRETEMEAVARGALGEAYVDLKMFQEGVEEIEEARRLYGDLGNVEMIALMEHHLGEIKKRMGSDHQSLTLSSDPEVSSIVALADRAKQKAASQDWAESVALFCEAIEKAGALKHFQTQARLHCELANVFWAHEDFLSAALHFSRAHLLFEELGQSQNGDQTLAMRTKAILESVQNRGGNRNSGTDVGEEFEILARMHLEANEMTWAMGSLMSAAHNMHNGGAHQRALSNALEARRLIEEASMTEEPKFRILIELTRSIELALYT